MLKYIFLIAAALGFVVVYQIYVKPELAFKKGVVDGIHDRDCGIILWKINGMPNRKMKDVLSQLEKNIGLKYDVADAMEESVRRYRRGYNEGMSHRNVELGGINLEDRIMEMLYNQ